MRRKILIAVFFSMSLAAGQAMAQDFQAKYSQQMQEQGFTNLTVSRTWLGRTRITAVSKTQSRELVFDRNTGEILRDYSEGLEPDEIAKQKLNSDGSGSDSGEDSSSGGESSGEGEDGGDSGGDSGGDNSGSGGDDSAALDLGPSPLEYLTGGARDDLSRRMLT